MAERAGTGPAHAGRAAAAQPAPRKQAAGSGRPAWGRIERLVLASGNAGKLAELRALLAPYGVACVGQRELGIDDAEEPHPTFLENALAKARHASRASGLPALADDSGLCVPALGGAPGVRSARFAADAGAGEGDAANNAHLVEALRRCAAGQGRVDRLAFFVSVVVLVRSPDDPYPLVADAAWQGEVIDQPRGEGGFGYDSHFLLPQLGLTAAQLTAAHKNGISHRGLAMAALLAKMTKAGAIEIGPTARPGPLPEADPLPGAQPGQRSP